MQKVLAAMLGVVYSFAAMENIIYDSTKDRVLAIAASEELAHDLAECICYITHSTSLYAAYGIKLVSRQELMDGSYGEQALFEFNKL